MPVDDQPDQSRLKPKRRRGLRVVVWCAIGLWLLLFLAYMVLPVLDGMHARVRATESSAAATVRTLQGLQHAYVAAGPHKGFACQLGLLETVSNSSSDPFFVDPVRSGYRFEIRDCRPDANGVVNHYWVVGIPLIPGKTGKRAFCSDETDVIRYDDGGSATNCIAGGTAIN